WPDRQPATAPAVSRVRRWRAGKCLQRCWGWAVGSWMDAWGARGVSATASLQRHWHPVILRGLLRPSVRTVERGQTWMRRFCSLAILAARALVVPSLVQLAKDRFIMRRIAQGFNSLLLLATLTAAAWAQATE